MKNFLSDEQLAEARAALLDGDSDVLIDLIYRLNVHVEADSVPESTWLHAIRLGWVDRETVSLTPFGLIVADPIREYRLWLDRDRKLHTEALIPHMSLQHYEGKSILEPGSGFGCNLLSWSRVGGRFVGVEPVPLYRQFTEIFAMREGVTVPEVVDGSAESLPFPDDEFDLVVCYSVHQYTDIRVALREMTRVLRPGGQLQIMGGTIGSLTRVVVRQLIAQKSLGPIKWHLRTFVNTLSYQFLGHRIWVPSDDGATSAPIYPTYLRMSRWMSKVGLVVRDDLRARVGPDTCFVADKPPA